LCDGVHCQAYKGKNYSLSYHAIIAKAVSDTRDLVMVDSTGAVIDAPFHANCGGQTMNSEDVWGSYKYYLRSVSDSFCKYQRNSSWEKKISLAEWKNFLISNKFHQPFASNVLFDFTQGKRKSSYHIGSDSVSLRKVREYFNLKSTFFNVKTEGDSILISGKGFGHGVGLCQDGAIQMAKHGYSYTDIINHYFKGIKIVSYKSLPFYQSVLSND
jgi:stage II sporulation protein D